MAGLAERPYPSRRGRLVRHLDEVTPAWLTALLGHRYPGVVVESLDVVEVKNSHTTKLRVNASLNEIGRAAGIPRQLCLKANWSEGVETGDITETEARFYFMMGDEVDFPVPHSFYADWDGDGGGRGIVVMEDLGAAAGAFGHSGDHLGVDGVASGLESLASLHGSRWGSPRLAEQRWLARSMATPRDTELLLIMYNYLDINIAKSSYRAVLPDWLYERPELLNHAYDELAALEREQPGPLCLVHGDAHQGNSFLRAGGQRVWCDWQMVRYGHPWRDVNYFMVGALTVDERRRSARALFEHYHGALQATGAAGVASVDDAWHQFRRWTVYGMQAWACNLDRWGQSSLDMVERFFAAAEDWSLIEELTSSAPRRPIVLRDRASAIPDDLRKALEANE